MASKHGFYNPSVPPDSVPPAYKRDKANAYANANKTPGLHEKVFFVGGGGLLFMYSVLCMVMLLALGVGRHAIVRGARCEVRGVKFPPPPLSIEV